MIAKNYARISFRNALNGFLALECDTAEAMVTSGGRIRVYLQAGIHTSLTTEGTAPFAPLTSCAQELPTTGGLLQWALKNQNI